MRGRCRGTSPSRPWTQGPLARRAGARPRSPARRGRDRTAADPARRRGAAGRRRRRHAARPRPAGAASLVGRAQAALPPPLPARRDGARARPGADRARARRRWQRDAAAASCHTRADCASAPRTARTGGARPGRQLIRHPGGRLARLDLARPAVSRPSHRRRPATGAEPLLDDLGSGARPRAGPGLPPLRQREAHPPAALGHPRVPRLRTPAHRGS